MSSAPSPFLNQHRFNALCQLERCRAKLGGFHFPYVGGLVIFACHRCRNVSTFRNESFGIVSTLLNVNGQELDPKTGRVKESA